MIFFFGYLEKNYIIQSDESILLRKKKGLGLRLTKPIGIGIKSNQPISTATSNGFVHANRTDLLKDSLSNPYLKRREVPVVNG